MTTTAREYVAEQRPTLDSVEAALEGAFALGPVLTSATDITFYDTFDGLLHAAGIELGLADGEPTPDAARAVAGGRALLPLARVRLVSQRLSLRDELDKTVVRLELLAPGGLTPRVRVEGLRGYERECRRAVELLGLGDAQLSLREEAIIAAGGRPEGISAKVRVELDPSERADAATASVLAALWTVIDANLEGTIADTDSEFLHDYRVSVRKTRSVLKQLKRVFGPDELDHWRAEFRWLQQVTGDTRDLDVALEDFDDLAALVAEADRGALSPLRVVLDHRRAGARRLMVRELRSERARRMSTEWGSYLTGLTSSPLVSRPDADRPIDAVASDRITRVYRQMVKMGEAIIAGGDSTPAEDYHDLRKQGKELRYLLELFGTPLHDEAVVKPMVKALKELQDVLGRHQDREVQAVLVRSLADEVVALPGGPAALVSMGALVRALGADERAARSEFAAAFALFSDKDQRSLVKRTFS